MISNHFALAFDCSEVETLAARYLEQDRGQDERALRAGQNIASGNHNRQNLEAIFRWKTGGRGISRLSHNTDAEIADALQLALHAETRRSAIAVLCGLNGVEVPVASAVLTALKPHDFTIIDFRALEALGIARRTTYYSIDYYLGFLEKCRQLASLCHTNLRTLDRAMWQWSKERKH